MNVRSRWLALGCAGLLAVAACSGAAGPSDARAAAEPVATARCADPEMPELQAGLHLLGDREPPVPYSSLPPTSGWHRSGIATTGVTAVPMPGPQQVGLLEEGAVVVSHGTLAADQRAELAELADAYPEQVAVTPYPALEDDAVVAAAWGVLQRCDGVDRQALRRFVDFYASRTDLRGTHEENPHEGARTREGTHAQAGLGSPGARDRMG